MPQAGRLIAGRYELGVPIGSGGVGVVWRARDVLLARAVAVKEIVRTGYAVDQDEAHERTLREARAAARIQHPGVAAVYDVVTDDTRWYIVMELVEGRALSQVVAEEGPLPPHVVADVGRQVLAALAAGHAAGVLHRDLKPANVLLTPAGRAVLTDFGIASIAGDPSITRTGIVLGTPGYLAPERAQGHPATPEADVWSLGATLYAAASGRGPYDDDDDPMAAMVAVLNQDAPPLPCGGPLAPVVGALLDRDPARRPSVAEATRALARIAGTSPATTTPSPSPPVPPARDQAWERPVREQERVAGQPLSEQGQPVWERQRTIASHGLLGAPRAAARSSRHGAGWPGAGRPAGSRPGGARSRRAGRSALVLAGVAIAAVASVTAVLLWHGGPPRTAAAANAADTAVPEQFRVAAVVDSGGVPELFARDRSGHLVTSRMAAGAWSQWTQLPGGASYTSAPAAVRTATGQLAVVAMTASGVARYLWRPAGGQSWQGPVPVGSARISSAPALVDTASGRLEVFARLADGQLGAAVQQGQASWSQWRPLGGNLAGPPAAMLDSSGQPQVFAIGKDGALLHAVDAAGGWSGLTELPGGHVYTGVPAVGMNADGRLEVFARTSSGMIAHTWQQPGDLSHWGGPLPLIPGVVSDPGVFSTKGGRLEAFAIGTNGAMLHTWQTTPVKGAPWQEPPPSLGGAPLTGAPVPLRVNGQSDLFAETPAGTVTFAFLPAADAGMGASWSPWAPIGGRFCPASC